MNDKAKQKCLGQIKASLAGAGIDYNDKAAALEWLKDCVLATKVKQIYLESLNK